MFDLFSYVKENFKDKTSELEVSVDKHSENSKVRKTILKFISIFHPDKQTEVDEELPHLFGPESQRKEVLQIYEKLSKLLSLYGLTVSALQLRDNQAWEVLLSNGILLRLGNRDLESRLKRFCRAYPAVFADKPEQLTSVDLRYARGMAVQWKQQMGR